MDRHPRTDRWEDIRYAVAPMEHALPREPSRTVRRRALTERLRPLIARLVALEAPTVGLALSPDPVRTVPVRSAKARHPRPGWH